MLLAQLGGWSIGQLLVAVIIVAACIAICWVAMRQFGVSPPAWAVNIFWIVITAIVAILAIRFLLSI